MIYAAWWDKQVEAFWRFWRREKPLVKPYNPKNRSPEFLMALAGEAMQVARVLAEHRGSHGVPSKTEIEALTTSEELSTMAKNVREYEKGSRSQP